jgi:hypothetical protein
MCRVVEIEEILVKFGAQTDRTIALVDDVWQFE